MFFGIFCFTGCNQKEENHEIDYRVEIGKEIAGEISKKIDVWYPKVIDNEYGGYLSNFSYNWEQEENQEKMIVTQARHLWTLSKLGTKYPEDQKYAEHAAHGFEFLKEKMWDPKYGGFFQLVTREGETIPNSSNDGNITKTLYGNAFALYGLAAYYGFSNDPAVLALARNTFNWLDTHSYDPVYGGYFQPLARDGTPNKTGYPKDYNSGIHILEALTEFYSVWPDDKVRDRLSEMFYIVRDTMVSDKGNLKLYFEADWTHLSFGDSTEIITRQNINYDHITPGHDIETAFLLFEAAHVLGMEDDDTTHRIAKKLTDHTLGTGWDIMSGGFYDTGYYFKGDDELTILRDTKNWWAQAEGLNTLLIMADLYPDDPYNYFEKFVQQWEYIKKNIIDHEHGGWYNSGIDKRPESASALKSQIWKGNYHTFRALLGCLERLEVKE